MINSKRHVRGRTPNGDPNPVDIHVGNRIRLRRTMLGFSQEKLAQLLGVSFQQIQKYERGRNRIGASRLWDIKNTLKLDSTDYFFSDMPGTVQDQSPRMYILDDCQPRTQEVTEYSSNFQDPMTRLDVMQLINGYLKIRKRNITLAEKINSLIETMSKNPYPVGNVNENN